MMVMEALESKLWNKSGQTVGVVGESGCGKSVLLIHMRLLPQPMSMITNGSIIFRVKLHDLVQRKCKDKKQ